MRELVPMAQVVIDPADPCGVGDAQVFSDPRYARKILSQTDGPAAGYVTLLVEATLEPGVTVGRHTHPGIESAYVLEAPTSGFELPVQGQETRIVKKGDGFQIPPVTPHAGGTPSKAKTRLIITYVVEKGKPLASPA